MFDKSISIGKDTISENNPVYIIAEAGVNHGGDIVVAKKLIDIAVKAGANAVKFQAFRTDHLILENIEKAAYQKKTTSEKESQSDMLRKLELKKDHYLDLKNYCLSKKIQFLITPFDETSLSELEEIGVEAYKIASTDATNLPFLIQLAKTGKPLLLSTGMCYMEEVEAAVETIRPINKKLVLLQCTANYPIKDQEANLHIIPVYKNKFNCLVGYSDHSIGIGAAPFAIPLGACVVEKHFTLDKNEKGPDHLASLNPEELIDFVKIVRKAENFIGKGIKEPTESEKKTKKALQKYLVSKTAIKKNNLFSLNNIVAKRTGGKGISPIEYRKIVGTKATRNYQKDEIIEYEKN